MENILINLTSDASGLQPGIDGLVQMQVVDKELGDQVKKTNDEMQKQGKTVVDSASKAASSLDKLSASFKGLDKSIVGGAYTKQLQELQKNIQGTSNEFKQLALAVDFAKKKQAEFKPNTPEWQELEEQIQQASAILEVFGKEGEKTEGKTQSLKARLRELKNELAVMEEQGLESTETFEKMAIEAAQLEDQIGDTSARISAMASDTANIDAVLQGVNLLAGGFQLAAGAQALLGSESEDLQKGLVKLNAIMAVTASLQQITNTLQNQSVLVVKAQALGNAVLATSNRITAATFSAVGLSVAETSVAFKVLRTAIITTGIGALVVGLGFLIDKISDWTSESESAVETQKRLADSVKGVNEAIIEQNNLYVTAISATKANLEKQLALLQANGGSQLAQLSLRQKIAEEDKKIGEASLENLGLTRTKLDLLNLQYNQGLTNIQRLQKLIQLESDKGNRDITQKQLEAEQAKIDSFKPLIDAGNQIVAQINSAETASAATVEETNKLLTDKALKSATAFAEAKALVAKAGTKAELNAQINAIRVAQQEQLHNVELTAGERVKINADAQKEIANLRFEYEKKALEDAKRGIDAHVLQSKEGSKEELDFKLQSLQLAQEIELKDKELTDNKKLEIEARYLKQREELTKAYNKRVAEDAINGRIAELSAQNAALQLSVNAATNDQLLANKKQLIDEEAALEVISITDSEKNEELRRVKIAAVYARALADKQQLEREKQKAEIDSQLTESTSFYDREIAKSKVVLDNEKATFEQRKEAQADYFSFQQDKLNEAFDANETARRLDLVSDEQYRQRKRELNTEQDQLDQEREQSHQDQMNQIREFAQQTAVQLTSIAFGIAKKGYDAEEARIKELYDSKKISEQEYNNQLKQIRKKQDQDAKAQALFQTLILQGPTILKGFEQGGFAGVAAAFALFFAMLGSLQGAEPPAYKDGEIRIQGPGTETSDSINARLSKNESVIKASMSKKHEGVLRAINEDRFIPYIMQYELPKLYQNMSVPEMPAYVQNITNQSQAEIDYEKLGDVFAQKLAENPQHIVSFDENGFHYAVKKGNDLTHYVNKKLST